MVEGTNVPVIANKYLDNNKKAITEFYSGYRP